MQQYLKQERLRVKVQSNFNISLAGTPNRGYLALEVRYLTNMSAKIMDDR